MCEKRVIEESDYRPLAMLLIVPPTLAVSVTVKVP